MSTPITKPLFCAGCQAETEHAFVVTLPPSQLPADAQLTATCACGRNVHWPASLSKEELTAAIAAHNADNRGQIAAISEEEMASHPILQHLSEL